MLGALGVVSIITLVVSALLLPFVIVRIPSDYYVRDLAHQMPRGIGEWVLFVGRNLVGLVLLISGVAMLFLPGQGILTILAAFAVMAFPGKRVCERWVLDRSGAAKAVNWLRARRGVEPLQMEE